MELSIIFPKGLITEVFSGLFAAIRQQGNTSPDGPSDTRDRPIPRHSVVRGDGRNAGSEKEVPDSCVIFTASFILFSYC
jgi:hypothetical protein